MIDAASGVEKNGERVAGGVRWLARGGGVGTRGNSDGREIVKGHVDALAEGGS